MLRFQKVPQIGDVDICKTNRAKCFGRIMFVLRLLRHQMTFFWVRALDHPFKVAVQNHKMTSLFPGH